MNDEPQASEPEQLTQPYVFDLSKVEPIKHRWIDRGLKLSCEDAGHAHHEAWKHQKAAPMQQD